MLIALLGARLAQYQKGLFAEGESYAGRVGLR